MAFDDGARAFPTVFDPLVFFRGRTVGWGAVRSFTGRTMKRCFIETQGSDAAEYEALHFDEIYTFDDGAPDDRMRWAVVRGASGELEASEASVTRPIRSMLRGPEWRVLFHRRAQPPTAGPVLLYDARFSLVAPEVVLKSVGISLLGLRIATLSGFHRRQT